MENAGLESRDQWRRKDIDIDSIGSDAENAGLENERTENEGLLVPSFSSPAFSASPPILSMYMHCGATK